MANKPNQWIPLFLSSDWPLMIKPKSGILCNCYKYILSINEAARIPNQTQLHTRLLTVLQSLLSLSNSVSSFKKKTLRVVLGFFVANKKIVFSFKLSTASPEENQIAFLWDILLVENVCTIFVCEVFERSLSIGKLRNCICFHAFPCALGAFLQTQKPIYTLNGLNNFYCINI